MLKEFLWMLLFAIIALFVIIFAVNNQISSMIISLLLGFVFYDIKHLEIKD